MTLSLWDQRLQVTHVSEEASGLSLLLLLLSRFSRVRLCVTP